MNNNNRNKKTKNSADGADHSVNNDPKQGKVDPQLTELDGLKKGGVPPTVNQQDRAKDGEGRAS